MVQNMGWVDWMCFFLGGNVLADWKTSDPREVSPVFVVVWLCLVLSRFVTLNFGSKNTPHRLDRSTFWIRAI